jgi:Transposase DDE domain
MSYGYMKKEVARIREDIEALVTHASQQDAAEEAALGSRRGDELPAELARREARLAKIEAAMRHVEAEAKAEADAERTRRFEADAERQRSGKKRQGKAPKEVDETPADKVQMSFTDPELHIMQTNNKGWDYCGNAQVSVDGAYQIIVACDVTDATNDKQQAAPMGQAIRETLKQAAIEPRRNDAGERQAIPATLDSGYYSDAAPQALEALGFEPYIATARQRHPAPAPEVLESSATAKERMTAKVRSPAGQALYSRRKVIVEPVFGQIKEARGFRRFLLRGLAKVRGEWRLVCLGHNLLKLWRYGSALRTV